MGWGWNMSGSWNFLKHISAEEGRLLGTLSTLEYIKRHFDRCRLYAFSCTVPKANCIPCIPSQQFLKAYVYFLSQSLRTGNWKLQYALKTILQIKNFEDGLLSGVGVSG